MNAEEIFHDALARPQAERRAFLAAACAGDEPLQRRLEALLHAHENPGSFLAEQPPMSVATVDNPIAERPGMVIGPYKLLELIGEGGFGIVCMAEQQEPIRRKVALKVLKPGMDTRQVVARFEAERQALALMDHPNIAKVLDGGQTSSGRPYFVMDLVKGVPITDYCDQAQLTLRERLELFVHVCQAVQHAHQKGIIHRDLKPSNVLVTLHDGTPLVKIIDFGIAKALGQQLTDKTLYTGFAQMVGTPLYMAPEQAALSNVDVDTRSDIYSLGVLLYELLTGTTPFGKERFSKVDYDELRRIIREEEPPKPSTRISTLGQAADTISSQRRTDPKRLSQLFRGELDWIVMRCLEKDRNRRYETASGLAADVQHYLHDEPVQACPPSAWYRFRKMARRNKAGLATAGLVLGALIVGTAVSCYFAVQANDRAWDAEAARDRATTAEGKIREDRDRVLKAERTARLREAEALVGQAHGTRNSRRPGQRFETLAALDKAAAIGRELGQPPKWFDRLRNEAIAALALPDVHITQAWDGFPPGTWRAAVSHDFELYARTTKPGACSVRRVADDVEIAALPALGEPAMPAFGPGRLLLLQGESYKRLQLWDLGGPEPALRLDQRRPHPDWDFRADGRLLALGNPAGSFDVYATDTGKLQHRLDARDITRHPMPCLHPTEPVVAVCSYFSPWLQVRDLHTGAVLFSHTLPWRGSGGCAWSPDGRTLAVSDGDSGLVGLYAFDSAHSDLRWARDLRAEGNGGTAVHFNPAGDRLAARGWSGKVHLFDVDTGRLLFSTDSLAYTAGTPLRFNRTGGRLAAARVGPQQEQVGLWSVADAREYRALIHDSPQSWHHHPPAVHPDGRLTARGFMEDCLALFDLETGRKLEIVKVPGGVGGVCFDGAGNLLTNGRAGFFRWPVRRDPAQPGRLTVGPPQRLPFRSGSGPIATSRDGQVITQRMYSGYDEAPYAGGWILHPCSPQPRRVEAGTGMRWTDVSPDGRWVAFGVHVTRVNVYEAATGRRAWQSPDDGNDYCRFSPDGRWLVTANDGGRAYRVGTWEPAPRLGPGFPWDVSPDSQLVVLGLSDGVYRLVELTTGRELARLEDPEQFYGSAVFTPDGTRMVVTAKDGLRVWDLRRIREELVKLGLDWDAPAYKPLDKKQQEAALEVRVDLGELGPAPKPAEHSEKDKTGR
jgi:serine/threonine protein kinase/WD40 repeat protein